MDFIEGPSSRMRLNGNNCLVEGTAALRASLDKKKTRFAGFQAPAGMRYRRAQKSRPGIACLRSLTRDLLYRHCGNAC